MFFRLLLLFRCVLLLTIEVLELVYRIIKYFKYLLSFMRNSLSDSNFHGAPEKKESQRSLLWCYAQLMWVGGFGGRGNLFRNENQTTTRKTRYFEESPVY